MRHTLPEGLQIWAVDHDRPNDVNIEGRINQATTKEHQKTLFVEISRNTVENQLHSQSDSIYLKAIQSARQNGWRVSFLDRAAFNILLNKIYFSPRKIDQTTRAKLGYINQNLREKYWVQKLIREKAQSGDVVIMHPVHISGFLEQSGLNEKQVQWIHQKPSKTNFLKRLTQIELINLEEKRRKARQKKVKRKDSRKARRNKLN